MDDAISPAKTAEVQPEKGRAEMTYRKVRSTTGTWPRFQSLETENLLLDRYDEVPARHLPVYPMPLPMARSLPARHRYSAPLTVAAERRGALSAFRWGGRGGGPWYGTHRNHD